jgi:hypothetical protein
MRRYKQDRATFPVGGIDVLPARAIDYELLQSIEGCRPGDSHFSEPHALCPDGLTGERTGVGNAIKISKVPQVLPGDTAMPGRQNPSDPAQQRAKAVIEAQWQFAQKMEYPGHGILPRPAWAGKRFLLKLPVGFNTHFRAAQGLFRPDAAFFQRLSMTVGIPKT